MREEMLCTPASGGSVKEVLVGVVEQAAAMRSKNKRISLERPSKASWGD